MTTATPPAPGLTRRRYGRGHGYTLDGAKAPGVTKILEMVPKDALKRWAAKSAAAYAVDNWARLARKPVSQRLDDIAGAPDRDRDSAARRGTQVHRLAVGLIKGADVEIPDELFGHVMAYRDFVDTLDVQPVAVELVLANRSVRYCGTLDLVADLPDLSWMGMVIPAARWLLDVKTSRSGIWPETALQVCAYSHGEFYLADDGTEHPMRELGIQEHGGVHVRADGWDLYPLECGQTTWDYFQHLVWLHSHQDDFRSWVGDSVDRPAGTVAATALGQGHTSRGGQGPARCRVPRGTLPRPPVVTLPAPSPVVPPLEPVPQLSVRTP